MESFGSALRSGSECGTSRLDSCVPQGGSAFLPGAPPASLSGPRTPGGQGAKPPTKNSLSSVYPRRDRETGGRGRSGRSEAVSDLAVLTIWGGVALFVLAPRLCALMGTTRPPRVGPPAGVSPRAFLRGFLRAIRRPALMLAAVLVALSPAGAGRAGGGVAWANSAWLTDPLSLGQPVAPWNAAGRPVPAAPPPANPASAATAPRQIQARAGDHYRPPGDGGGRPGGRGRVDAHGRGAPPAGTCGWCGG